MSMPRDVIPGFTAVAALTSAPNVQVVVFDRNTRTLLVTDLVVSVPASPPDVIAANDVPAALALASLASHDEAGGSMKTTSEFQ